MSVNHEVSYFDSIQLNIIVHNKEKIHSYSIERAGASFLKLSFSNIKLPKHSYVEFHYGENSVQREFFHGTDKAVIMVHGEKVNIRVVLTKAKVSNLDDMFSFVLDEVEYNYNQRDRTAYGGPFMCFEGTEMAEHALATGVSRVGRLGACSLIGNENHLLSNVDVVSSTDPLEGEIWFNWFNQSCDNDSPINEPVRLKPGSVVKSDRENSSSPSGGYVLFTLDEFDYENSHVKELFGGLMLSQQNPPVGEMLYVPRHDGPMTIMDKMAYDDGPRRIMVKGVNEEVIHYSVMVSDGARASPLLAENNQIVGMHRRAAHGSDAVGVSAQKLYAELGSFISDSNESVIGLGNVISHNLELTTFDTRGHLIPVDLDKKGAILPFDTVTITDYDSYSLIEVEAIDLISDEVFPLTFKASLVDEGNHTHIHDDNVTGEVFLKIYDFDLEFDRLVKFWLVFQVNDPIDNIRNYVIRTVLDYYNPLDPLFSAANDNILELKIWKDYEIRESSVSYTIKDNDNYGFVALYNGQGPVDLVWSEDGYSEVKVFLTHSSGDEILVNLRGQRKTGCSVRTMNSAVACALPDKYSQLVLSFHPEDNENLQYDNDGIYRGAIPLQAKRWGSSTEFENILVNVSLRDLIFASEPENLSPR